MLSYAVSKKYSEKGRPPYEVDANQVCVSVMKIDSLLLYPRS